MFKKYKNLNLTTGVPSSLIFICFTAFALLLFLSFTLTVIAQESTGCQDHSITGLAWSDNIGWISLSCRNENQVGEGTDYGIDIDEEGNLSGFIWSEKVGWITFNPFDLEAEYRPENCPNEECDTFVDSLNMLNGWAYVISNEEWISLRGEVEGEEYGVEMRAAEDKFFGWAWGGNIIGWIAFDESGSGEGGWLPPGGMIDPTGEGSYINLGDFSKSTLNEMTFSAWIYWEGLSGQSASGIYGLIADNSNTVIHFEVINNNGDLRLYVNNDKKSLDIKAVGAVRKDKWTHVAFSYNARGNVFKIYADGGEVRSQIEDMSPLAVSPKSFHALGRSDLSTARNFTGMISAVRIYEAVIPD